MKDASSRVPFTHQFLIWFSGLRGAVAFALGVTFLEHPIFSEDIKGVIFGTTVMVIVFTVIVLGTLTPHMLRWLGISGGEEVGHGHHEVEGKRVEGKEGGGGEAGDLELKKMEAGGGEGVIHKTSGAQEYGKLEEEDEEAEERVMEATAKKQPFFAWLYKLDAKYIRPHFTTLTQSNLETLTSITGDQMERDAILAAASSAGGAPATTPATPAGPGSRSRKQSMLNVTIGERAPFVSTVSSPALAGPLGILEKAKSSYAGPSGLSSLRQSPGSSQQDVVVMESVDLGK
ncbi:Sodium/hydrogen exchanger 8 [Rhizophlyctis rosea]|nr:Sodium/hydrogen exchanger 8 [Rhizophlyctis rosea]